MAFTKKALFISSLDWESPIRVGSHLLAKSLVEKGWRVGFVSYPVTPLHRLSKNKEDYNRRKAQNRGGYGKYFLNERLWSLVPWSLAVPRGVAPFDHKWFFNNWYRLSHQRLVEKVIKAGFGDVELLYFDNPYQNFWLKRISHKKSVLRIADANEGFEHFKSQEASVEKELSLRVNLTVCSAKKMADVVRQWGGAVDILPNGFDPASFVDNSPSSPHDLACINGPKAIYVGSVNYWFDYQLLEGCARRLPEVAFVIIGPVANMPERLKQFPNLHFLGRKAHSELGAYMRNSDVGIIPFDRARYPQLVDSINPLKLYEYLACGLPVVSVPWQELKSIDPPVRYAEGVDQFAGAIKGSISDPHDPALGYRFIESNRWDRITELLLSKLDLSNTCEEGLP
ncbi:glycosyltransferase [Motiliproteus sediminis]|uniref:GumK N-terminal domain-containing glycosyltransferase n=1 Tax=Motiliproteus sediminis TaxID=1468178 RepID=UPI001AEF3FA2|nr:glycosyltransferase [Motiliproteus sediminis]